MPETEQGQAVGQQPRTETPDAYFREQLAQGRVVLQRSRGGKAFFYPRVLQPGTGETDLEWFEASGEAVVYSTTTVRRQKERGGDYNVALVDFVEGGRMMSRIVGIAPDDVRIGMHVQAKIEASDGTPMVVFEPQRGAK